MKRTLVVLLAAALLLCACTGGSASSSPAKTPAGTPLFEFVGGELKALADDFAANMPVAVEYVFHGEGSGGVSPLYGRESVIALYDALSDVYVLGGIDTSWTDSYGGYDFVMADGSRIGISLNHSNLEFGGGVYALSGADKLFSLSFPTFGRDLSFTSTHPDPAVQAFAADFFDNPPVSVTLKTDGGPETVMDDPEKIEEVYLALAYTELCFCGETPSPGADGDGLAPVRSLRFTMPDGTEYGFTFEGRNYVYEFPAPIGVRYYWVGDTAGPLFELF